MFDDTKASAAAARNNGSILTGPSPQALRLGISVLILLQCLMSSHYWLQQVYTTAVFDVELLLVTANI